MGVLEKDTEASRLVTNIEIQPNPFTQITDIRYRISDTGTKESQPSVNLKIYDISGRLVKNFGRLSVTGHELSMKWHGTDGSDRPLPGGVYVVMLSENGSDLMKKVLLLR